MKKFVSSRIISRSYLEVHGFHLVLDSVGPSHQAQHWWHLLWVMEVLHHSIDGVHHPAGVLAQLAATFHLLRILHVLKLAEVLFGWWEVHKEPETKNETVPILLDVILSNPNPNDKKIQLNDFNEPLITHLLALPGKFMFYSEWFWSNFGDLMIF